MGLWRVSYFNLLQYFSKLFIFYSHLFPVSFLLVIFGIYSQEAFMENYFSSQRDHIFRNVEVLIYVFDIESRETMVIFFYFSLLLTFLFNSYYFYFSLIFVCTHILIAKRHSLLQIMLGGYLTELKRSKNFLPYSQNGSCP